MLQIVRENMNTIVISGDQNMYNDEMKKIGARRYNRGEIVGWSIPTYRRTKLIETISALNEMTKNVDLNDNEIDHEIEIMSADGSGESAVEYEIVIGDEELADAVDEPTVDEKSVGDAVEEPIVDEESADDVAEEPIADKESVDDVVEESVDDAVEELIVDEESVDEEPIADKESIDDVVDKIIKEELVEESIDDVVVEITKNPVIVEKLVEIAEEPDVDKESVTVAGEINEKSSQHVEIIENEKSIEIIANIDTILETENIPLMYNQENLSVQAVDPSREYMDLSKRIRLMQRQMFELDLRTLIKNTGTGEN